MAPLKYLICLVGLCLAIATPDGSSHSIEHERHVIYIPTRFLYKKIKAPHTRLKKVPLPILNTHFTKLHPHEDDDYGLGGFAHVKGIGHGLYIGHSPLELGHGHDIGLGYETDTEHNIGIGHISNGDYIGFKHGIDIGHGGGFGVGFAHRPIIEKRGHHDH